MKKSITLLCGSVAVLFSLAVVPSVFAGGQKEHSSGVRMHSDPTVTVRNSTKYGETLVGSRGKTLYVFQKDSAHQSNCTGGCARLWPPLEVSSAQTPSKGRRVPGTLGTITRSNGKYQVTYNGMPLYYFLPDSSPGEAAGQGIQSFGGLWYIVPPKAATFAQAENMSGHATAQAKAKSTKPKKSWG